MTLGEKIRQLREGKYTQEVLAEKMGVHNVTISKWENGTQTPNSKRISDLARILGTTVEYLLEADSPEAPSEATLTKEKNTVVVTLKDGNRVEAPATPEGYAFLKELFLLSMRGNPPAVTA